MINVSGTRVDNFNRKPFFNKKVGQSITFKGDAGQPPEDSFKKTSGDNPSPLNDAVNRVWEKHCKNSPNQPNFKGTLSDELETLPDNASQFRDIILEPDEFNFISDISPRDLKRTPYYDKLADDVVSLITPDKHVLLLSEEGVSDDLLTHKFMNNVMQGKYEKNGITYQNADVQFYDAKKLLMEKNILPDSLLTGQILKNDGMERVVFVKNYQVFLSGLIAQQINPAVYLKEASQGNTHIIGIMPKQEYEKVMDFSGVKGGSGNVVEGMNTLKFNGLGSAETKELLKKDKSFVDGVFASHYYFDKLKVTKAAIDEIVDRSSAAIDGAFPKKALDVLNIVAASKMQTPTHHKGGSEFVITSTDVKNLFENHPERLAAIKTKSESVYQIAENIKTKLRDVGGNAKPKAHIQRIINFINNPAKYKQAGAKPLKGALLEGGPGTGKTLLARAAAGEAKVPFIYLSASDLVDKFIGQTSKQVGEVFENARDLGAKSAKKTCILFIDEVDAIAKKRGEHGDSAGNSEVEAGLNKLLSEMDGFKQHPDVNVILMAATNRKDILDPAFLRRFDRTISVEPPETPAEREEILAIHSRGKAFENEEAKGKVLKQAAAITEGFSGAELEKVMQNAALIVAESPDKKFIDAEVVKESVLQTSMGDVSEIDKVLSVDSKIKTQKHEYGHAVCMDFLQKFTNEKISFISTQPRDTALGMVSSHKVFRDNPNRRSLLATLATYYAGGLAEPGINTVGHASGVSQDFKVATALINRASAQEGLGIYVPQGISFDPNTSSPTSQAFASELKKDQELFSSAGQEIAKKILKFHKGFIDKYHGQSELMGDEFSTLRQKWLVETGKDKQIHNLERSIVKIFEKVENTKTPLSGKIKQFVVRAFKIAA